MPPHPNTIRARELRRNQTPYERDLWKLLRDNQMEGFHFRRQYPIGPYIADFACIPAKLIIELDGNSHNERQERDANRDETLKEWGWTTLRFRNVELRDCPEGVWLQIASHLNPA